MIAHKHITKIVSVIMVLSVCLCLCAAAFSEKIKTVAGSSGISQEYESKLFSSESPIEVNIIMDSSDWSDMLDNAISEEYKECTVEINGTTFYRVGIRPKGNTSLSSIASDPTTDRYSFKLEFDKYVDGQTCFGLDKLVLNNNYADATNMKEALVYDLFKYVGADASLYNYAKINVNGEYWGVYLALEAVEDSFLLRNYGVQSGELYKPESMNIGGGGNGGAGSGNGGADLNYTDDELDSYSTIWDGEITDAKKADRKRVVTALKNISQGTDLQKYMDIDNLVRYMAVHVFSVNEDSLSGSMTHNYYLYETGGMLNLIPWDYNLAFGGMGGEKEATSVVNDAIDNAFSATNFFDTLTANEEYNALYYDNLKKVAEYISGGEFEKFYNRVRSQIDELVKTDPTAFYSYDDYTKAAETLFELVKLRGESIEKQVDGTIPSTAEEQKSADNLVDASNLALSVLGSMNNGGPNGGFDAKQVNANKTADDSSADKTDTAATTESTSDSQNASSQNQNAFSGAAGQNGTPPEKPDGEAPGGMTPPDGMTPPNAAQGEAPSMPNAENEGETATSQTQGETTTAPTQAETTTASLNEKETESAAASEQGETTAAAQPGADGNAQNGFPGGNFPGGNGQQPPDNMGQGGSSSLNVKNLAVYGICLAVMLLFLLFAALYKRRPGRA
ncbi:MAG: CotH kinase family protein [Clostridia bacterium]|nr:CotH kinase family protein [Clostridia bacterium]